MKLSNKNMINKAIALCDEAIDFLNKAYIEHCKVLKNN